MNIFGFSIGQTSSQPQNQIDKGREAMKYFHNQASKYSDYTLTLDALVSQVSRGQPQVFLEGLGFSIESIGINGNMDARHVQDAMEALADKGRGKVPSNMNSFFQALSSREMNFDFTDAVGFTAIESAKDIGKGAVAVGGALIDTGKMLTMILPFAVVGAVLFVLYSKTKRLA